MSALQAIELLRQTRLDMALEASAQCRRDLDAACVQEAQAAQALERAEQWLRQVQRGSYSPGVACSLEALSASCLAVLQRRQAELAAAHEQVLRCRGAVEEARRLVTARDRALDKVHELQSLERSERQRLDEQKQVAVDEDVATFMSTRAGSNIAPGSGPRQ